MRNSTKSLDSRKPTKVLLSIKPEYAKSIFSGEKKYEYRKIRFSKKVDTVVIYVTSPVSRVVAEFDLEEIICQTPEQLWSSTSEFSGVDEGFFFDYFSGREIGYALKIGTIRKYDSPFSPVDHYGVKPPQSYVYL